MRKIVNFNREDHLNISVISTRHQWDQMECKWKSDISQKSLQCLKLSSDFISLQSKVNITPNCSFMCFNNYVLICFCFYFSKATSETSVKNSMKPPMKKTNLWEITFSSGLSPLVFEKISTWTQTFPNISRLNDWRHTLHIDFTLCLILFVSIYACNALMGKHN